MTEGYLMLQRRFFSHPLWREQREFSRAEAFLDLLQLAAYAHREQIIKGNLVKLAPGQLCGSQRYLADRWGWSTKKVRHFLALLESDGSIEPQKNREGTIITLCNYERYNYQPPDTGTEKNHQGTTKEPPRNRIKEREEREEETPPTPQGGVAQEDFCLEAQAPPETGRILPENWKRLGLTDQKRTRVNRNSPAMIRIGALLNRRADNLWTVAEAASLLKVKPNDEEIDLMEEFYTAIIPPDPITGKNQDFRRRSISVLLNNWNDELDKARLWKAEHRHRHSA